MSRPVASVSISARAVINMHSLNNEGSEGNTTQTRKVWILADGRLECVNAISGATFKHSQTEHLFELAREQQLPLCHGCQHLDANRINADQKWIAEMPAENASIASSLLARCTIDDVAGNLITSGGRSLPRKSIVEFGWAVGIPPLVQDQDHFHVKFSLNNQTRNDANEQPAQSDGANLGQMIFHRPVSSGIYALVCHLELARIGYNELIQEYAIDQEQRAKRAAVVLQSVLYTFLETKGAMRSTQLPHLVSLEGVVTTSRSGATLAPLVGPETGGHENPTLYREQAHSLARSLNGKTGNAVTCEDFETLADFADRMRALIDEAVPAELPACNARKEV